jgi:hypothetical protein
MARKRAKQSTAPKKPYIKVGAGFLATTWYTDGQTVNLTDTQAKYPLMYGTVKKAVAKA